MFLITWLLSVQWKKGLHLLFRQEIFLNKVSALHRSLFHINIWSSLHVTVNSLPFSDQFCRPQKSRFWYSLSPLCSEFTYTDVSGYTFCYVYDRAHVCVCQCFWLIYLVAPGQQDDFKIGVVGGRRHFEHDGLDDDRAVRMVLHGVTSEQAENVQGQRVTIRVREKTRKKSTKQTHCTSTLCSDI